MMTMNKPFRTKCTTLIRDLLIDHKKECAKTGKYVEAKLTDDRLTQLKAHLKLVRANMLDKKHNDEVYPLVETSHHGSASRRNRQYW